MTYDYDIVKVYYSFLYRVVCSMCDCVWAVWAVKIMISFLEHQLLHFIAVLNNKIVQNFIFLIVQYFKMNIFQMSESTGVKIKEVEFAHENIDVNDKHDTQNQIKYQTVIDDFDYAYRYVNALAVGSLTKST